MNFGAIDAVFLMCGDRCLSLETLHIAQSAMSEVNGFFHRQ
jgi:hypothetical protein